MDVISLVMGHLPELSTFLFFREYLNEEWECPRAGGAGRTHRAALGKNKRNDKSFVKYGKYGLIKLQAVY